jgi:thiamine kinase-like enzyme
MKVYFLFFCLSFSLLASTYEDEALILRQELDALKSLADSPIESPAPKRVKRFAKINDSSTEEKNLEDLYFKDEVTIKRAALDKSVEEKKVKFHRSRMDGNLPKKLDLKAERSKTE